MTAVSTSAAEPRPFVTEVAQPRDERHERLVSGVARLRSRTGGTGDRDRYLLVLGGVLVPLGLLCVVLGWVGASRTVLLFEQLPYIASGGLLGLALVVAGGFVYWSYWQTLLVREARSDRADTAAAFSRLEALLERALEVQAAGATAPAVAAEPELDLVVTPRGTMLHRRDCEVVLGREDLKPASPDMRGARPCRLCDPLSA